MVDILLASYNGEHHIEAQILSIVGQSFKDWRLLIHDDGSTDSTVQIVKKWSEIDKRIWLINDGKQYGSAPANFMHLVKYAEADFVMFCDQDDIWFDNKIEIMLNAIKNKEQGVPQVVYSNSYVWKPNEGILGKATHIFPKNIEQFLFLNSGMQGCVSIFNRSMAKILANWDKEECAMHDHLLHLAGLTLGEVEYLPTCLMLYRNHENNVTGETRTSLNKYREMLVKKTSVVDIKHYNSVSDFFLIYKSFLKKHDHQKIKLFLDFPNQKYFKRMFGVITNGFQLHSRFRLFMKLLLRPYIN